MLGAMAWSKRELGWVTIAGKTRRAQRITTSTNDYACVEALRSTHTETLFRGPAEMNATHPAWTYCGPKVAATFYADQQPKHFAHEGQEERCAACGRVVQLTIIGHHLDDTPIWRWVAVRKSKRAPRPIDCPADPSNTPVGLHRPAEYTYNGAPFVTG